MNQTEASSFSPLVGGLSDDEALELQIETARRAATREVDPDIARAYFAAMAALIAQRSKQQIERMEHAQGLRA